MEMKDFIIHCLGVSNDACEKFSEILWDLGEDISEDEIYIALNTVNDFSLFGDNLIKNIIYRIISLSCDKYPILKEYNFDCYVNGKDSHLYYNGSTINNVNDIEVIASNLEENE